MIRRIWQALWNEDITSRRQTGKNQYRTTCPFHEDSHPSCDVDLDKNVFLCRSCKAKGGFLDAIILAGYARNRDEAKQWLYTRGILP